MAATIVFVGDVHLGRRPANLPDDLAEHDVAPAELTPAAAWRRVVDRAIAMRADALVLAGDVVESENARFEAFGPLHDGVRRLVEAGVAVYAVAGNHDVEALPRLERAIEAFRLVGRDGTWETVPLLSNGRTVARLLGWSFPTPHVRSSPLDQPDFPRRKIDDLPLLGVVHGDLTSPTSDHAPLSRSVLAQSPADAWFLGHVHQPGSLGGPRPIGYLGSLVGLDSTETGAHGPWVVRLAPGAPLTVEQLATTPLGWEDVEIDVEPLGDPRGIDGAFRRAVELLHARLHARSEDVRAVGCRIVLHGHAARRADLARTLARGDWTALRLRLDGVLYFVAGVVDRSRSALRLEELASSADPAGLLASRLLALERADASAPELIRRARQALEPVAGARTWSQLDPVPLSSLSDEALRALLLDSGVRALEALLEQRAERER